jgi:acyl-CoA thioester hydrolase
MTAPFRHHMRVRWSECDQQGVVFYPNYLSWFDVAMTELMRAGGLPYGEMVSSGTDMVVAEAGIRYRASARFDDEIDLVATVTRLGSTSMTTALAVERDGAVLAEGELRHVFVDPRSMAKRELPGDVRTVLQPFAAAAADPIG